MRYLIVLSLIIGMFAGAASVFAHAKADSIAFQGSLSDASDNPVPDGVKDLTLTIWTDSVGGSMVHSETVVITTSKGLYSTCLGCSNSSFPDIFNGQTLWLQTQLAGSPPMTPRTQLRNAPYSLSSVSVHGDISTNPGQVAVGDLDGDGALDLVSTSDVSEMRVMRKHPGKVKYNNIVLRAFADSTTDTRDCDDDDDGIAESAYSQRLTPTTASLAIKTKGTSAQRYGAGGDCDDTDSEIYADCDDDNDGIADRAAALRITPTTASLAINSKGTSAKRLRAGSDCDDQDCDDYLDCDDDGDGVAETSVTSSSSSDGSSLSLVARGMQDGLMGPRMSTNLTTAKSTRQTMLSQDIDLDNDGVSETSMTSSVARKSGSIIYLDREGNEVLRSMVGVDSTRGVVSTDADSDGDGVPESDARMQSLPTTSSVAIKTKGTGADANRLVLVSGSTGTGSAVQVCSIDDDGDGVPEQEIEQMLTPVSSSMAIKTKGTGAAHNRSVVTSSTDSLGAISLHSVDFDDDGVADRSIREQCDDGDASISIDEPGVHITMARKGWDGTIKGSMRIDDGTELRAELDGDGNGYLKSSLGIDVLSPTHPIEHSSGAHLTAAGAWVSVSDKHAKENFRPIDGEELLEKIEQLEISEWNYKAEGDEVRHIGPTAQDFKETFGLGENDKTISTMDPSGVALAAIKELNKKNEKLEKENQSLRKEMDDLKKLVEKLAAGK